MFRKAIGAHSSAGVRADFAMPFLRGVSGNHFEAVKLSLTIAPCFRCIIDSTGVRSLTQCGDERLQLRLRTFRNGFDSAIGEVAHGAAETERRRSMLREVAVPHTLDASADADLDSLTHRIASACPNV
jgi:hypothetical protein